MVMLLRILVMLIMMIPTVYLSTYAYDNDDVNDALIILDLLFLSLDVRTCNTTNFNTGSLVKLQ